MTRFALAATLALLASASAASAEQLKIAAIESFSGPGGDIGVVWAEGIKYGVSRVNAEGGFNGQPIALLEYDDQTTPSGASDKLRAAIADGARIIVSGAPSFIAAQVDEDIRKYNIRNPGKEVIYYSVGSESYDLTASKCQFWFFRAISNPYVRIKALVSVMKEQNILGDKVYSINQNYGYGMEMQKAQAQSVKDNGAEIVEATLHDVAKIQDFSPYIAKIKASGAETVLTGNWGNDLVLLMKAANNAGLKVRFGGTNVDNVGVIGSAGEAALGAYQASPYNAEAGGDAGKAFAEDYKAKTGHNPVFSATGALGVMMLGEALKQVKSADGSIDIKQIALAIEKTKFQTPLGEMSIRAADHQAIIPIAVSVVSKDAMYKADGTDMGLKLVKVVPGPEAAVAPDPACHMERPN
jgi:branched-chain amino acid transport system substrate-binding protein